MTNRKEDIVKLKKWRDAYDNGTPLVSDAEYDKLFFDVLKDCPNDKFFKKAGTEIEVDKVELPTTMGSLNKENPESSVNFLNKYSKDIILISPKFDGLSLKCVYENGKLQHVYTRGDGFVGQDVTERGKHIGGIPKKINIKSYIEINGECICYKSIFKKYYSDEYSFPRNFCVGTLRPKLSNKQYKKLLETDEDLLHRLKRMQFIAFGVNTDDKKLLKNNSKFDLMLQLQIEGFSTIIKPAKKWNEEDFQKYAAEYDKELKLKQLTKHKRDIRLPFTCLMHGFTITGEYLGRCIDSVKKILDVDCDGIVIEIDDLKKAKKLGLEVGGLNPKSARAIKHKPEDQEGIYTKVKSIEWNISKRGNFIPRLNIKPINLCGAEISNITGNNYAFLVKNGIGIGSKVKVIRSGDVIPRVIKVKHKTDDFGEPKKCPYCGTKLKKGNANLYCPNENCIGIEQARILGFFSVAKVDYISGATITQFIDAGYDSVKKILKLTAKKLLKLEGFKETKANKLVANLEAMRNNMNLATLMHASGFFDNEKTALGTTKLQWIIDYLGAENITDNKIKKSKLDKLFEVDGIGDQTVELFVNGIDGFIKWYKTVEDLFDLSDFYDKEEGPLTGKVFCWTGFRDKNLKALIEDNGGIIKDNLTKDCNVLFSAGSSTKTTKASNMGIKIVPSGQAYNYINKLIGE